MVTCKVTQTEKVDKDLPKNSTVKIQGTSEFEPSTRSEYMETGVIYGIKNKRISLMTTKKLKGEQQQGPRKI